MSTGDELQVRSRQDWPLVNESGQAQADGADLADGLGKVPLTARLLLRDSLTARRAAAIIALFTAAITVAGGILERVARPS